MLKASSPPHSVSPPSPGLQSMGRLYEIVIENFIQGKKGLVIKGVDKPSWGPMRDSPAPVASPDVHHHDHVPRESSVGGDAEGLQ